MTSKRGEEQSVSINSGPSEREQLLSLLEDKERRHHLASVVTKRTLAEQIREIRMARQWTQSDLAHATGKVQETISQLENPDYGSYTIKTLQRLAEAFDVTLTVRFDAFSELVDRMTELSPGDLAVPDYAHDAGLFPAHITMDAPQTTNSHPHVRTDAVGLNDLSTAFTPMPRLRLVTAGSASTRWDDTQSVTTSDYSLAQMGD